MPKRPDNQAWRYWRTVAGAAAAAAIVAVGAFTGHVRFAHANDVVDCAQVKCVALTFDDGPTPYTDRLLSILTANKAKATFFEIGNKVAANPAGAKRVVEAGMELGNHTWEHPNMTTLPPEDVPGQLSRANDAIAAATGVTPKLWRPPGGLTNAAVNEQAGKAGLAGILWDVIPYDWINDSNTAASRLLLMTQIKPGSVVLLHDTYSSTVDLVVAVHPGAQGQRLPLRHGQPAARAARPGQRLRRPRERAAGQRPARHPRLGDSVAAQHTVAGADAQLPDHRCLRPELGRTEQR